MRRTLATCSAQSRGPRRGWGGRCRCSAASWRRRSPTPCPPRRRRLERSPRPYHRVHAELGHVLLALGPGGVHALQRAPQRRRIHVAPRGDAQHDVVPAADAQVQHGQRNLRLPAGPHVRQQIQAGLARVAAASSRCGSCRTAPAKSARCPQRPASPAPRGPLAGAGRQPTAAQRALAVCTARVFCLSAAPGTSRFVFSSFKKKSRAPSRAGAGLCTPGCALHHLHSTSCSSGSSRILVPRLNLSPVCAGLLMVATLELSRAAMSWQVLHRTAPGCTSAASKRLRWMVPRLAPVEHARRLPLQHPLHGPVHVAVPVEAFSAGS